LVKTFQPNSSTFLFPRSKENWNPQGARSADSLVRVFIRTESSERAVRAPRAIALRSLRLCGAISFLSVEIIAHRGASHDAPENTLPAIKLAWEQGADAVEVDVHLSRDGRVAVIHDYSTAKTAGVKKKVCDQTWAELQKLDAGSWKHRRWAGACIPSLEAVLATVPKGKRLFIEVKCGEEFVAAAAADLQNRSAKEVVVIGFSLPCMKKVKAAFPELEVCWIVEFKRNLRTGRWSPSATEVIEKTRAAGLDGLDVGAKGPITREFIQQAKQAGLTVYVWTVDSARAARKLIEASVDGITTNRPGWLRRRVIGNQ
jgi:glycerophosphoryl diester phosphodiesterase